MARHRYRNPNILLVWPRGLLAEPPEVHVPSGYALRVFRNGDEDAWIRIHRRAVPVWSESDLQGWLDRYLSLALPGGILFASQAKSGDTVATAGCIHHTRDGMFPFGGQLAWVARSGHGAALARHHEAAWSAVRPRAPAGQLVAGSGRWNAGEVTMMSIRTESRVRREGRWLTVVCMIATVVTGAAVLLNRLESWQYKRRLRDLEGRRAPEEPSRA
jgi:hypothetical protein